MTITTLRRRRMLVAVVSGFFILLVLAFMLFGYFALFRPVTLVQPVTVIILNRTTFLDVARSLERRKIIPNALAFRLYGRFTGKAGKLKLGEYEVTSGMRPVDIIDLLISGHAKSYWLTVPEGKWATEVDSYVSARWPDASQRLDVLVQHPEVWEAKWPFLAGSKSLEGFLFPDTYRFAKGVSAETIIASMLQRFNDTCYAEYRQHPPEDGRTLREVLVLASLVEAEAKIPEERPIIAGVYMNRLQKGMKLDCDATLIYAWGQRMTRVLNLHKRIDSPYNTYMYTGLPPGPICNPGLSCFKAALHPAKVDYLYYVARGDGSHIFSHTLAEQEAAIRKVRGK